MTRLPRLALATALASPFIATVAMSGAAGGDEPAGGTALTIYSSARPGGISAQQLRDDMPPTSVPGYAMVRQDRDLVMQSGRNSIRFTDVAAQIDPTTVAFRSLTDPAGTRVVEQNYQFDLVGTAKLLEKYVDREITVEQRRGNATETVKGILASTNGGVVLRAADGSVRILNSYDGVNLPSLPGGLITRPTLVWDVAAQKAGTHKIRVAYQTGGMTWWSDYNVLLADDQGECRLDLAAWVSIVNRSGAGYTDAKLKLIAGDVHRAPPPNDGRLRQAMAKMEAMPAAPAPGFEEKAFFEYHLYTLPFSTTLPDNSTKQLELFPAATGVRCERQLVYSGQGPNFTEYSDSPYVDRAFNPGGNRKVEVSIQFRNAKDNRMGVPLPAGRVRVAKQDTDGAPEFIGEDVIDHTARDEKVTLKLGNAFDVVGERRQVDFRLDTARKTMEEDIEIRLRNQKDAPVTVTVKEYLYRWSTWQITKKTAAFEKLDAHTTAAQVTVAKGAEAVVKYTVRYTW